MKNKSIKFYADIKALVFVSVLIYFAPLGFSAAYFIAVLFHELGHVMCLAFFHKRILAIRLQLKGLLIEHESTLTEAETFLCSAAGPALSLAYAFFASSLSDRLFADFFALSAGFSLALGLFNSLPVVPLDGAAMLRSVCRMLKLRYTDKILFLSSCIVSEALLLSGIYLLRYRMGHGLIAVALLLVFSTLYAEGIVKTRDLR